MITTSELASYKQYGRVLCITNGIIEAYVTLDVGPRIIRFGFVGGQNILRDDRDAFAPCTDTAYTELFGEGKQWENLGGHRIWTSPESYPHTYYPDTASLAYEPCENGAVFTPNPEIEVGIAKQLEIQMDPAKAQMRVVMRVQNTADCQKQFSIWGLTVCAQGGTAVIPMNTNDTGLLHNRIFAVWPYTDMSDPRLRFEKTHLIVRQDPAIAQPLKVGLDLAKGYMCYHLGEDVFEKRYQTHHPHGIYPDGGCSFETYTNDQFIELESLSELKLVSPGETAESTEIWSLSKANSYETTV